MKNYLIIAAAASLAVAAMGGGYFQYLNQTKAAFVIAIDITGGKPSDFDTSEVPQHIANKSSVWSETDIRFTTFSNFQNHKIITVSIPAQFPLLGNPAKRNRQLQTAYQHLRDTINTIVAKDKQRPQSVIYAPMIRELNRLAATKANIKEAIFYTDCQENTNAWSIYRYADLTQVVNQPERVKAFFEKQVPLDSLAGVTVYFIFNAPTPLEESRFILMANLWGAILKAHGATVVIGSNLTTN